MHDTTSDAQCEIIENLNDIDRLCSKPELSSDDIDAIYGKYIETMTWIDEHLKSVENEIALQLIEFMKHFFDVI